MTLESDLALAKATADLVKTTVARALVTDVTEAYRIGFGQSHTNDVFLVESSLGRLVFKGLWNSASWRSHEGMRKLAHLNVFRESQNAAAPLLVCTKNNDWPKGFAIYPYVQGANGKEAVDRGYLSPTELNRKLGQELRKIHDGVQSSDYGHLSEGGKKISRPSLGPWLVYEAHIMLDSLGSQGVAFGEKTADWLRLLGTYQTPEMACLAHLDLKPDNLIVKPDLSLAIIDWENARFDSAARDIAALTWASYFTVTASGKNPSPDEVREAFLFGYGDDGTMAETLDQYERAFHFFQCLKSLIYLSKRRDQPTFDSRLRLTRLYFNFPP